MKKTALILLLAFLFCEAATAQRVILYKNFTNYFHQNRDDWTVGYRMKKGNYLTIGLENWHFRRTLFPKSNTSSFGGQEARTTISFGRRLNIGILHFYDKKKERKWFFYDHFFGQVGYQYHETVTVTSFGASPSAGSFTSGSLKQLRCIGVGIENGFVYRNKRLFLGPAIINGYVVYFDSDSHVLAFDLERFNKGMYLWLPMVRFVVGYRIF